ncbi:MAG: hypothetical protein GOV15_04075 [Candidatus Diapherotrites archaeon]|nr:hypothetical protein [Candidatus Diapherotrites archaeon]
MAKKKKFEFLFIPVFLLIYGLVWLLKELGVIAIDIPWGPIVLILLGFGWIIEALTKQ